MMEMFIRMFLYAKTKDEAIEISDNILLSLSMHIYKKRIIESKPYWKINGIYEVEITIGLKTPVLDKTILENFLKSISNKWIGYGEPVNEILISRNDCDIVIYDDRIELINMFIDDEVIGV